LDRRYFLRYLGVGAAVGIGVVSLGLYELQGLRTPGPSSISSTISSASTTSTTLSGVVSTTASSSQTFDLELSLFADWHGDGAKQSDEPALSDSIFQLRNGTELETVAANTEGNFELKDLVSGTGYGLVFSEEFLEKSPYRFLSFSNSGISAIRDGFDFVADSAKRQLSVGLTVGPLTLPFLKGAQVTGEPFYVDLDPSGKMRDWKGGTRAGHDNHFGTDYFMPVGQTIVAPAPGIILEAEGNWPNVSKDPNLGLWDDGNRIVINHGVVPPYFGDFYTIYAHLNKISYHVGQAVRRGEKIAESGHTGNLSGPNPHLHFQCGGFGARRVDPYRDTRDPESVCYWTKDNDPQFPLP
jgi:murein DD-endopeptidase MepM/ murein hydrolase activator NlpD